MHEYRRRRIPTEGTLIISKFLRQETIGERGKSTCYITSIVNAAIALGAINLDNAVRAHKSIMDELIQNPAFWKGAFLRGLTIGRGEIVPIIERHIPRISLGAAGSYRKSDGSRVVYKSYEEQFSYDEMGKLLSTGSQAFVAMTDRGMHSYAIIGLARSPEGIVFVNPLNPSVKRIFSGKFPQELEPNSSGKINATPVLLK